MFKETRGNVTKLDGGKKQERKKKKSKSAAHSPEFKQQDMVCP